MSNIIKLNSVCVTEAGTGAGAPAGTPAGQPDEQPQGPTADLPSGTYIFDIRTVN